MNSLINKVFRTKSKSPESNVLEQSFKAIFDCLEHGLIIFDSDSGKIIDINKWALEFYKYNFEEAISFEAGDFSSQNDQYTKNNFKLAFDQIAEKKSAPFIWQEKNKNGKLLWSEITFNKIELENSKRLIAVIKDAAEQKYLEEQADYLNKTQNDFVISIAEQLRTPLGSMRWNLEQLMEKTNDFQLSQEAANLIKKNYEINLKAVELVNKLTHVSKIERNKIRSHISGFSLTELIDEIIEELNPEIKLKSLDVKFRINKEYSYNLKLDRIQIKDALKNIINNAIKYAFQKTDVTISLNKKNNYFEIKTTNVGIGIPAKDNRHVFDKFFTADNNFRSSQKGSGLGLFIAKSYIERIDGSISFSSSEDKKTIFIVRIPVTQN